MNEKQTFSIDRIYRTCFSAASSPISEARKQPDQIVAGEQMMKKMKWWTGKEEKGECRGERSRVTESEMEISCSYRNDTVAQ